MGLYRTKTVYTPPSFPKTPILAAVQQLILITHKRRNTDLFSAERFKFLRLSEQIGVKRIISCMTQEPNITEVTFGHLWSCIIFTNPYRMGLFWEQIFTWA